jgi:predicted nucleic acid-binding protein
MADQFFDTSAAAKRYRVELGTPTVDALLAQTGAAHVLSALTVVEFHSVLARLTRTGQISASDFHVARGRFLADIAAGLWNVVPVTAHHFQDAQQLLIRRGLAQSLRTLDALQLAVAIDLNAAAPLDAFVCADANLCSIATAEGLTVVNPEVP